MSNISLKYRIAEILASMPIGERLAKKNMIKASCEVNSNTLSRWLNATEGENQDIQGYDLAKIAHILNVTVDELFSENARAKNILEMATVNLPSEKSRKE